MTSRSTLTYAERAARHSHPVARMFLETAERKELNVIVSADLTTSAELLKCAIRIKLYIMSASFNLPCDQISAHILLSSRPISI